MVITTFANLFADETDLRFKVISARDGLSDNDITIKSPNDGLSPYEWDNIIGLKLNKDIKKDENISFEDLN